MKEFAHLSDELIIEKVLRSEGNNELLEILYERYKSRVYFKCLSILKNQKDAEDLTHEIFIKAFTKLNSFKGNSDFSLWIHSISFNTCITFLNKSRKVKLFSIKESFDIEDEVVENDDKLVQIRLDKLDEVLAALNTEDRLILIMKYLDNASLQDIQKISGLGLSAVKMRLKRAKQRMLELYNQRISPDYE